MADQEKPWRPGELAAGDPEPRWTPIVLRAIEPFTGDHLIKVLTTVEGASYV